MRQPSEEQNRKGQNQTGGSGDVIERWKTGRKNATAKGAKDRATADPEEVERRRQAGLAKYQNENPDHPTKNRKWTKGTEAEYQRHETAGKSRGKCKGMTKFNTPCPANASPSGSGFCSTHESEACEVGEKVSTAKACRICGRNPRWAGHETDYCQQCYERRARMGQRIIKPTTEEDADCYNIDDLGDIDDLLGGVEPL